MHGRHFGNFVSHVHIRSLTDQYLRTLESVVKGFALDLASIFEATLTAVNQRRVE